MRSFKFYAASAVAGALVLAATPASANLVINPTFDSSITSDANAATIMNTINSAIGFYESTFTDNITVNITFQEMSSGLGASSTFIVRPSYSDYITHLTADATSAADATALSHLPIQANDPVTGHTGIVLSTANARAVGLSAATASDGTISLNTSICNLDRVSPSPSKYDLYAVACHEMDEVLGTGSWIDRSISSDAAIRAMDLFRYNGAGGRSFTDATTAQAFFSIDGTTDIVQFNQSGSGDWGDWIHNSPPQVQDFSGTPGAIVNPGFSEITALDVIGYNGPVPVPEPASMAVLGLGAAALIRRRKRG